MMKALKKNKGFTKSKGFTLVELIVVIAIIGILAAVLIPSITGYIQKARISKMTSEARSMNTILASEIIFDDVEFYTPAEVQDILLGSGFTLESGVDGYAFWYNVSSNKVEVLGFDEVMTTNLNGNTVFAAGEFEYFGIESLSALNTNLCYIDKANNEITNLINTVKSLVSTAKETANNYDDILTLMINTFQNSYGQLSELHKVSDDAIEELEKHFTKFNPGKNALYIDESSMYMKNLITTENGITLDITGVVFTDGIKSIPSAPMNSGARLNIEFDIIIPNTVLSVANHAFSKVTSTINIYASRNVVFSPVSLSSTITTRSRTSSIDYNSFASYDIKYVLEAKKVDGSTVRLSEHSTIPMDGNDIDYDLDDDSVYVAYYLVPNIEFNNSTVSFNRLASFEVRTNINDKIVQYTAVAIDENLNGYRLDNIGYFYDVSHSAGHIFNSLSDGYHEYYTSRIVVANPLQGISFSNFDNITIKVKVEINEVEYSYGLEKLLNQGDFNAAVYEAYKNDYIYEIDVTSLGILEESILGTEILVKEVQVFNNDSLVFCKKIN
ncbi:MAG TPA: prepilin-type N-terminal cleavage/methylation domain-containing protein [Gallicola sp.]|nr:prepilin-type N-terminal cleavage/methylation domain-containing protein [Gallicola sp.]